jgi:hypothetical protein
MNFESIEKNSTLLDIFYYNIGSTKINDTLYLTLIPFGLFSVCLNIISFVSFLKIKIKSTKMYDYLRVYTLNSCVFCLIGMFSFLPFTSRYFKLTGNYYVSIFHCLFTNYIAVNLYFYGNLLDIIICLERLSIFIKILKRFQQCSPYLICLIALIICFLIELPILFSFQIRNEHEFYTNALKLNNDSESFTMCGRTDFLETKFGQSISIIAIFVRDIMTLCLEITLSIFMIYYLKIFFKNKSNLQNGNNTSSTTVKNEEYEKNFNRSLKMTISISIISILINLITFGIFLGFLNAMFKGNRTNYMKNFAFIFVVMWKSVFNFLVFYKFNNHFKNVLCSKSLI